MTQRPVLGVGGVILREGTHVLLVQRGHPPGQGTWSLPGGKVGFGESLSAAVSREILEETSLRVRVGPLLEVVEITREGFHYVVLDYLCEMEPPEQEPAADTDADAVRWVKVSEIAQAQVTPAVVRVVQRALALKHESRTESG